MVFTHHFDLKIPHQKKNEDFLIVITFFCTKPKLTKFRNYGEIEYWTETLDECNCSYRQCLYF